jgi:predicted anti-sigma-YlaC factor YlaD
MIKCVAARLSMSEWLDGRLHDREISAVNQHLLGCADCRAHWQAMQHVSSLFNTADAALPPSNFTARTMQRLLRQEAEQAAALSGGRSVVFAWGSLAVSLALLLTVAIFYGLAPARSSAAGGPSLNFLSMSMRISDSAIRTATMIENAAATVSQVLHVVPLPLLVLILAWALLGTAALAFTVGSLVAAYRPMTTVPVEASTT